MPGQTLHATSRTNQKSSNADNANFLIKKHCLWTNYRYQPTGTASCAKICDDPIVVMVVWVIFIGCDNMNAVFNILNRLLVKNSMFESWNTCIS